MEKTKKLFACFTDVRAIVAMALFIALSIVFGKFLAFNLTSSIRISFENLPIILSGILFGPICGGVIGCASDLISYFLSSQVYPPNLLVTLGATSVGVVSGIVSKYIVKKRGNAQIIISGGLAHIVGSMIIKPIGLFQFYSFAVFWRIPLYFLIAPLEIMLICLMFKNKTFRRLVDGL